MLTGTVCLFPGGCQSTSSAVTSNTTANKATRMLSPAFSLSTSFTDGGAIPLAHACKKQGGGNQPPRLSWSGAPAGASSFTVVMDDEDAPCGKGDRACRHWAVFNIPADVNQLDAGQDLKAISGVTEGRNYLSSDGYAGPCPPKRHIYRITIFALREGMPKIVPGTAMTRSSFESAYRQFIIGSATVSGHFP